MFLNQSKFNFQTFLHFSKTPEEYFKTQVPNELVKPYTELFYFLRYPERNQHKNINKMIEYILKRGKEIRKRNTFKNKSKNVFIYSVEDCPEDKKGGNEEKKSSLISLIRKENVLVYISYDSKNKKFSMFIPKKMRIFKNLDIYSTNKELEKLKDAFEDSSMFTVIYDERDEYTKQLTHQKISIQTLIKKGIKDGDKYKIIETCFVSPIELYNFSITNFLCMNTVEDVVELINI